MKRSCVAVVFALTAWMPLQAPNLYPVKVFANWSQPPKSSIDSDGALHYQQITRHYISDRSFTRRAS